MRKIIILFVLVFVIWLPSNAQEKPAIEIPAIPTSIEAFIQLRDKIATTPQGGAAMMVLALHIYTINEKLGKECFVIAADQSRLSDDTKGYRGKSLGGSDMSLIKSQIGADSKKSYVPNTYFRGTKYEDWYKMPSKLFIDCTYNKYSGNESEGRFKIYVKCTGADSPRPVTVEKNDKGLWKAKEWSSLLVGVKVPKAKDDF